MPAKPEHVKCVVVGDGAVGKTCLLWVYAKNSFPEGYTPTVFDNFSTSVVVDNVTVNHGLWDTAGQEEYDAMRPLSYQGTHIFLICFSVISKASLQNVKTKWYPEVQKHCANALFLLIGTKSDMKEGSNEVVSKQEAEALATELKAVKYIECSAKTRENIKEVFDESVRAVLKARKVGTTEKKKSGCSIL